jgi:hypothetical protein
LKKKVFSKEGGEVMELFSVFLKHRDAFGWKCPVCSWINEVDSLPPCPSTEVCYMCNRIVKVLDYFLPQTDPQKEVR